MHVLRKSFEAARLVPQNGTRSYRFTSGVEWFALQHCLASEFPGWTRTSCLSITHISIDMCFVFTYVMSRAVFHVIFLSNLLRKKKSSRFFATNSDLRRPLAEKPEHWPNWKTSSCFKHHERARGIINLSQLCQFKTRRNLCFFLMAFSKKLRTWSIVVSFQLIIVFFSFRGNFW